MAVKTFTTSKRTGKGTPFMLDGVRCHLNPYFKDQALKMVQADSALVSVDVEEAQEAAEAAENAELAAQERLERAEKDLKANPDSKAAQTAVRKAEAELDEARDRVKAAAKTMRDLMVRLRKNLADTLRSYFDADTAQHLANRLNDPGDPFDQDRLAEIIEWAQAETAGRPTKP